MSSIERKAAALLLMVGLGVGSAGAGTTDVCPARHGDGVQQIYLFDGKPEGEVYLAPDDDARRSNLYTLKPIYDSGRQVTIRCKYRSGHVTDVTLAERVDVCRFRRDKRGGSHLFCK